MGPRGTIERLLALQGGDEREEEEQQQQIADPLTDMAMVLLMDLCTDLAFARAGARGRSARQRDARDIADEQATAISTVLAIWEMAGFEVVNGPPLEDSPLEPPWRN